MRFLKSAHNGSKVVKSVIAGAVIVFCPVVAATAAHAQSSDWAVDQQVSISEDNGGGASGYFWTGQTEIATTSNGARAYATSGPVSGFTPSSIGGGFNHTAKVAVSFTYTGTVYPQPTCQTSVTRTVTATAWATNATASAHCAIFSSNTNGLAFDYVVPGTSPPTKPVTPYNAYVPSVQGQTTKAQCTFYMRAHVYGGRSSQEGTWSADADHTVGFSIQ